MRYENPPDHIVQMSAAEAVALAAYDATEFARACAPFPGEDDPYQCDDCDDLRTAGRFATDDEGTPYTDDSGQAICAACWEASLGPTWLAEEGEV